MKNNIIYFSLFFIHNVIISINVLLSFIYSNDVERFTIINLPIFSHLYVKLLQFRRKFSNFACT
jgi:hypothetical protein